jgi:hypothetical protein
VSYFHIDNLYKNQDILAFKECYAMEKIHGTSAHIKFKREALDPGCVGREYMGDYPITSQLFEILSFFSGGENHDRFIALFNTKELISKLGKLFPEGIVEVTIFGEAYGGKCQGMSKTYGKDLRFVAFEVKIDNCWLAVPNAADVVEKLGLEFVHYTRIFTVTEVLDAERDADSIQAVRNGMGPGLKREGIVLRPLFEVTKSNGSRVIAKYKGAEFCETASKREVDPTKRQLLEDAEAIANEWVTTERMGHVIDALVASDDLEPEHDLDISLTGVIIKCMIDDVVREAGSEIMDTKEARKSIGSRAAKIYKDYIQGIANV